METDNKSNSTETLPSSQGVMRKIKVNASKGRQEAGFKDMEYEYERYQCQITKGKESNVPSWLNGNYYKQSGAAFASTGNFLDGLAGIVSFHIKGKDGKVYYSSKVLDQMFAREYIRSGGSVRKWVGTTAANSDKDKPGFFGSISNNIINFWQKHSDTKLYKSVNPNVVVWRLYDPNHGHDDSGKGFYPAAATEAEGNVLKFNNDTLRDNESISTFDTSKGQVIVTAAHYYESQELQEGGYHIALELTMNGYFPPSFTFTYAFYKGATAPFRRVMGHELVTFSWSDRASQPVEKRASYMHSYAQSENYIVLFLSSQKMEYERLLARDFSKGFFGLFPKADCPMELMIFKINKDKAGTPEELTYVATYSTNKKMHPWHQANAFETNGGNTLVIDCSGTSTITSEINSDCFSRITVDLQTGNVDVSPLVIDDPKGGYEFPQINPLSHFHEYRNIYVLHSKSTIEFELVKVDAIDRKVVARAYSEKGWSVSEPVVVPRTRKYGALTKEEEEDCVVLVAVTNILTEQENSELSGKSFLAVLDPKDLSEICRIESPQTINYGLHSHFYSDEYLAVKI